VKSVVAKYVLCMSAQTAAQKPVAIAVEETVAELVAQDVPIVEESMSKKRWRRARSAGKQSAQDVNLLRKRSTPKAYVTAKTGGTKKKSVHVWKTRITVAGVGETLEVSPALIDIFQTQATNKKGGEVSLFGAIQDNVLVKVWPVSTTGNSGGVDTTAALNSDIILAAALEGYTITAQLHTHPGMNTFFSVTDLKDQEKMMEFIGDGIEFTFIVIDGFYWKAYTCTGFQCIKRPITLNGVELQISKHYDYQGSVYGDTAWWTGTKSAGHDGADLDSEYQDYWDRDWSDWYKQHGYAGPHGSTEVHAGGPGPSADREPGADIVRVGGPGNAEGGSDARQDYDDYWRYGFD